MPTYKLIYFNGKGRAEQIRYMFAESGTKYEDFRFEVEEMPKYKPMTPFGQVPVLEVDGKPIAQTCAIVRYLAREFDLEPETSFEKLYADMTLEALAEMFARFPRLTEKERNERYETKIHPAFKKFEKEFSEKTEPNSYFAGKKFSYIDIAFMNFGSRLEEFKPGFLNDYPRIKELGERVAKRPNIAAWIKKRPVTKL